MIDHRIRTEDLKVRPGESVAGAMKRLEEWARSFELVKDDPRLRFNVNYKRGTWITVDIPRISFVGAFPVVQVGLKSVTVGTGYLNNRAPLLSKVPIDGFDEEGKEVTVPALELEGPGEDNRSWVCAQVMVNPADGKIIEDVKEAMKIVHEKELHESHFDGGSPDDNGRGLLALAQVIWRNDEIFRVKQIVYQNKEHRFIAPRRGNRGRHFFPSV